jgi:hypothetical protein
MAGQWNSIPLPPNVASGGFSAETMLLLTDGTLLIHNGGGTNGQKEWLRYTPDPVKGYAGGSWTFPDGSSTESDMVNTRQYFASGVLRDGRVFVVGGESTNDPAAPNGDSALGEIYDSAINAWAAMSALDKPAAFSNIQGDVPSSVLPDGRVIMGAIFSSANAIWDPGSSSWVQSGTAFGTVGQTKIGICNEEGWTLLADGSVLTVDTKVPLAGGLATSPTSGERYLPSKDIWIATGTLPNVLPLTTVFDSVTNTQIAVFEIGPAILLPDQSVIAFGATGHTARFTPDPDPTKAGTWAAGPDFPADPNTTVYPAKILTLSDAPACLQPNGRVLVVAGTLYRNAGPPVDFFSQNSQYFEYDPLAPTASSLKLLSAQPPSAATSQDTWLARFLVLPTGQVMLSTQQAQVYIYSPDPTEGSYQAAWQPTITSFPNALIVGHSYLLSGQGLNGLSQANSYGDDAQMATNYPIVQITDTVSKAVYYLRTQDFSTLGVAVPGSQTCSVTVPLGTPNGAYSLVVIANGIPSASQNVEIGTQDILFLLEETTYGGGQVQAQINVSGTPAVFPAVLYVQVEGFKLTDCGITGPGSLTAPGNKPTVGSADSRVTFTYNGTTVVEDITYAGPQIVQFPFEVSFRDDSIFQDTTLFPPGVKSASLTISAKFTPPGGPPFTAQAILTLTQTPNPFILHNDPNVEQSWFLSQDLRVFQVTAGQHFLGKQVPNTGNVRQDATGYITGLLQAFNTDKGVADTLFDTLSEDEGDTSQLTLAPTDSSNTPVFNFALARVRTQDVTAATDIRVFFRMWAAQQTNATYDPTTTYASRTNPDNELIPVLGVQNDQIVTIPFFATPRIDASTVSMATQTDPPNVQPSIPPDPLGAEVHTFFGCWLDINQTASPQENLFPAVVLGDAAGPFTSDGPLQLIQSFARSDHQCLIAEISDTLSPVPPGSDPSDTDKLAQRNLSFVNVPNPGQPHSRRAPQTFEIRPSPTILLSDGKPDELLLDFSALPQGAIASIYLPATDARTILDWADRLYTTHRLTAADPHTIQAPATGLCFVPIPQGVGINYAGLLTLDFPATVKKGQVYEVVIRQVTSAGGFRNDSNNTTATRQEAVVKRHPWRRVLGQFRLTIPVLTKHEILPGDERLLSIMLWTFNTIPKSSRWYPIFLRYLEQLKGRVIFQGGEPAKIYPSPTGVWQIPYKPGHGEGGHGKGRGGRHGGGAGGDHRHDHDHWHDRERVHGKVEALAYDHFGDFEGFVLEMRDGRRRFFRAREQRLEELVRRACEERLVTMVIAAEDDQQILSIVLDEAR